MRPQHTPVEHTYGDGSAAVDCTCGLYEGGLYSYPFGARVAFLDHVVTAIATESNWPETYSADGDVATI